MDTTLTLESSIKTRDPYVDILKGIGIMSIVVGHATPIVIPAINFSTGTFVYGYHIMIFMFVLGFLFKGDKNPPFQYIGKTVFSMGKLYIGYSAVFLLLHNILLKWGFISGEPFTFDAICTGFFSSIVFNCEEAMMGACWFVPMYIVAAIIFSTLFYIAEKSKFPMALHIAFTAITMTVGVMMHYGTPWYLFHIQTSILAIPVCYLGFFCKKYWERLKKFVSPYAVVVAAVALHFLLNTKYGGIELAGNQIITPYLFYPVTLVGIYYCLSLAKLLSSFKITRGLFAYVGKNSFHIMALHFVCMKLVDVLYGLLTHQGMEIYSEFPVAFDFWYLYYPIGIFLPLGIVELCKAVKKYSLFGGKRIIRRFSKGEKNTA